jgi:formamidopyrimidine-DNA glycosylase
MPELPDVEVFRRYVDTTSIHQKIKSVAVRNEKVLGGVCARKLQRALNFRERLEGTRGRVRATLMNQKILAGIGNVYSDEILFQARLHPETSVAHLDGSTLEELHKETRWVLETAIEREADPHKLPGSFLLSHRHESERCPRGNGEIRKIKAAGRTAYYCLACQPKAR